MIPVPPRASESTTTITQCQPEPTSHNLLNENKKNKKNEQNSPPASTALPQQTTPPTPPERSPISAAPKKASYDICNCILSSPTNHDKIYTTTTTTTTTIISPCPPPSHYCSPSSRTCKPHRNCTKPARCNSASYCLEARAGACFCHPDTDDASRGYCMSSGPAGRGCPEVYDDCASNAACGGSRVCVYACCREAPFCVDVGDHSPDTPNGASAPERLLFPRRTSSGRDVVAALERFGVNPTWT